MHYKLEKPDLSNVDKEKAIKLLISERKEELFPLIDETMEPVYQYWDKVKYKSLPLGISAEEFWFLVKTIREAQFARSPIRTETGENFKWLKLPRLEKFLHEIDLNMGGNLFSFSKDINDKTKYKFISKGVMEEAIASSQLEGAVTTRKLAKQMLREGKKPKTISEHMIVNNYEAIKLIEEDYKNKKLDLALLLELHRIITKNTQVNPGDQGRLRLDSDEIIVANEENLIYHEPPSEKFVKIEIERFIAFANDDLEEAFLHPVIKAIMLHFWIGYLHPFVDGNGRLARLMFYWYLLKKNYWAFAYLPISRTIKRAHAQYIKAYVYTEQDEQDLTYFIDYNTRKIELARREFDDYLSDQSRKNSQMGAIAKSKHELNDRQIKLLQYLCDNPDGRTAIRAHMSINDISRMTAFNDLKYLENNKFLFSKKIGREVFYYGAEKIKELF
ncbi:MAG: Fic family protein [Candidatus Moraniibacteriota bacterium]